METEEQNTVTRPEKHQTDSTTTNSEDVVLPTGWTQHVDDKSGRTYYYNVELGQSSWDKPVTNEVSSTEQRIDEPSNLPTPNDNALNVPSTSVSPSDQGSMPLSHLQSSPNFPCLYRITFPSGAPVFLPQKSSFLSSDQKIIPPGKLVVCTSIEYWPMPFQEPMLCMPDGFVRARDVERFLTLTT